jgi:hypothetical protein
MSRKYKDSLIDEINDLSAGADMTNTERLSGADLEQLRLSALNGAATTFNGTTKTVGTNAAYPGAPSNGALTGSDLEHSAGSQ